MIKKEMGSKYPKRTHKPVKENPFVNRLMEEIQTGPKTVAVAGKQFGMVDSLSGELVDEMPFIGIRKPVDKVMFVKMYEAGIKEVFGAPGYALGVLAVLFRCYRDDSENYTDKIQMDYRMAVEDYGYEFKQQTFIKGMNYLINNSYIAASVRPAVFFVNPSFFFKGDRLTLVRQYIEEKKKNSGPITLENER